MKLELLISKAINMQNMVLVHGIKFARHTYNINKPPIELCSDDSDNINVHATLLTLQERHLVTIIK